MATERPSGLKQRSYLIGADEISWLETAAGKTKLTQSDLVRLALTRLRKDLGAARSLKLEAVETLGKGTKWAPVKRGGPPAGSCPSAFPRFVSLPSTASETGRHRRGRCVLRPPARAGACPILPPSV